MENYELLYKVGNGNFGVTYKARKRGTQEIFAMKCLVRGHDDKEYLKREILNHRRLQHPNVIQFKEVVLNNNNILGIVMEFADGGDLFDEILLYGGAFSEAQAKKMFQQLIAGVSYVHFKRVSHRDLKPQNILLTSNKDLKICDFGLAKSSLIHSQPNTLVGTPKYIAPEVCNRQYDGKRADVWSCGVTLYVMLTSDFPDPTNAAQSISELPSTVSEDCKDLLRHMLVVDPNQRFSIEQIKDHRWYLQDLPEDLTRENQAAFYNENVILSDQIQSEDDINEIIQEAKMTP